MRVIRVFPRRTKATPVDELVAIDRDPGWFDEADEVHVSVTFSWDLRRAEELARAWSAVASVSIGGPATGMAGGDFEPGMYLREGYTITSRGCPNKCWFCSVWRREGAVRELPIRDGWNVQDDNLLACSDEHIRGVFAMLSRQGKRPEFTGGLEATRMRPWIARGLRELHAKQMFFAYDAADDLEPLREAGKLLHEVGFPMASHALRCYVLCGYRGDTMDAAEARMRDALEAGFTPMAMLYRDEQGETCQEWRRFQRRFARPAMIHGAV